MPAHFVQTYVSGKNVVPVYYIGAEEKLIGYTTSDDFFEGREVELIANKRGDGSKSNPFVGTVKKKDNGMQGNWIPSASEWFVLICE